VTYLDRMCSDLDRELRSLLEGNGCEHLAAELDHMLASAGAELERMLAGDVGARPRPHRRRSVPIGFVATAPSRRRW
jgi:hypothetical protein